MRWIPSTLVIAFVVTTCLACNKDATTVEDDNPPVASAPDAAEAKDSPQDKSAPDDKSADDFDHGPWDGLLDKFVNEQGLVSYKAWKEDAASMSALDKYLEAVAAADTSKMDDKAKLAFYINAYNAYCARAVLQRYPLKSVMDVKGFFDADKHKVAGEELTLNDLENKKIREGFGEPRIHFVVNCASGSCPKIPRDALTRDNLDQLMEEGATRYIRAETRVEGKKVTTSKIFEWFKDDFAKSSGSVGDFLAKYVADDDKEAVKTATIITREYDWSLNEAK